MKRRVFGITILSLLVSQAGMSEIINFTEAEKLACELQLEGLTLPEFDEATARKEYNHLLRRWESEKSEFAPRVNTQIGNSSKDFLGFNTYFLDKSEQIRKDLILAVKTRQKLDSISPEQLKNPGFKELNRATKDQLDKKVAVLTESLKTLFVRSFKDYHLDVALEQNKKIGSKELWAPSNLEPVIQGSGTQLIMTAKTQDVGIASDFTRTAILDLTAATLTIETKKEPEALDSFKYTTILSLKDRSARSMVVAGGNEVMIHDGSSVSAEGYIKNAKDNHQKQLISTILGTGKNLPAAAQEAVKHCAQYYISSDYQKMQSEDAVKPEEQTRVITSKEPLRSSVRPK